MACHDSRTGMEPHIIINNAAALGAAIRARRKEVRLSIRELADMLGCSTRFLSEVERGKQSASVGRVIEIAAALGLQLGIGMKS